MYSERHLSLFLLVVSSSLMKDYFFKPPINQFSLNFLDQELEGSYRSSYQEEVCSHCGLTAQHRSHGTLCDRDLPSNRKVKANVDVPHPGSPVLELDVNLSLPGRKSKAFLLHYLKARARPCQLVSSTAGAFGLLTARLALEGCQFTPVLGF